MRIDLAAWSEQFEDLPAEVATSLTRCDLMDVRIAEPPDRWRLITESRIGVVTLPGYDVRVTPKLAIPRLMFLLSYAADPRGWRELGPLFSVEDDLFSAIAHGFALQAERALTPAPLRGYVAVEESDITLRGRVRMSDQLARRPGLPIPLELTYDDHLLDIPENRLIRGATDLLLRMQLVPKPVRLRLLRVRAILEEVEPAPPSTRVSAPPITRLNQKYAGALALAVLMLRGTSITTSRGEVVSAEFVFDMNKIFEDFLSTALRVALERMGGRVRLQYPRKHLDEAHRVSLKPDITWWQHGNCRAVIDAKYKALTVGGIPNADAYQMLAYCIAFGLDRGYLVYAKDAGQEPLQHVVRDPGITIQVAAIDVECEPTDVLSQVEDLANELAGGLSRLSTDRLAAVQLG
jgi:5-methylcytosine-specific restriction enzyme subunit McrC